MNLSQILDSLRQSGIALPFAVAAVLVAVLAAFHRRSQLTVRMQQLLFVAAAALAVGGFGLAVLTTAKKIADPPEWDLLCYWAFGQAIRQGSPYDTPLMREIVQPLDVSEEFRRELFCLYPPPCVIQFAPLGWMSVRTAACFWFALQWIAVGLVIHAGRRLIDPDRSWTGLLVAAAVVFCFRSTLATYTYGQTTLWIVWLALLMSTTEVGWLKGLAAGLATFVKPLGGILALDLIAERNWRGLLVSAVPLVISTIIFVAIQKPTALQDYLRREPLPADVQEKFFKESANHSLLAVLLRQYETVAGTRPLTFIPFVVSGGLLTVITAAIVVMLPRSLVMMRPAAWMSLGLLIYPGTLFHYGVLWLVPLLTSWNQREKLAGGTPLILGLFGCVFFLIWGQWVFAAHFIGWCVLMTSLAITAWRGEQVRPVSSQT